MPADAARGSVLRHVLVSVLLVAVALGGGAALFHGLAALRKPPVRAAGGPEAPMVRVERLRRGPYREVLRGYGVARAMRRATVSAEVAGVVHEVSPLLREGAWVGPPASAGDGAPASAAPVLVRIDTSDLEDTLDRLGAERSQAEADAARLTALVKRVGEEIGIADERLETAQAELERVRGLVPRTLTESDLDQQRLAVLAVRQSRAELVSRRDEAADQARAVEARIDAIRVQERTARRDLGRAQVSAPFPGRVTARHVDLGARVAVGTPLFELLDTSRVEVAVSLAASHWGRTPHPSGRGRSRASRRSSIRRRARSPCSWRSPAATASPPSRPAPTSWPTSRARCTTT
jgi:multidrug efflux pump subunit AcrA (membrane-fusion protein)